MREGVNACLFTSGVQGDKKQLKAIIRDVLGFIALSIARRGLAEHMNLNIE
jgi:hypothetical protein